MSLYRKFYETFVAKALSIVKFQKTEDAPLKSSSITRLRVVSRQSGSLGLLERLRQIAKADIDKAEPAINQCASPVPSNVNRANFHQPAVPPSTIASGSVKGKGLSIVCGVNSAGL